MIKQLIYEFINQLKLGQIDIYNEFSLQHELGIFLRDRLNGLKIQFERNIKDLGYSPKELFKKREIDIAIFKESFDRLQEIEKLSFQA